MKKNEDKTTTVVDTKVTTKSKQLSASEERVLRMRSGAGLSNDHRLENKVDDVAEEHQAELLARLALMEAQALDVINENPELRTDKKRRIIEILQNLDSEE